MNNSQPKEEIRGLRSVCYPFTSLWMAFFPTKPSQIAALDNSLPNPCKRQFHLLVRREDIGVYKENLTDVILILEKSPTQNPLLSQEQPTNVLSRLNFQLDIEVTEERYVHATFPNIKIAIHYCIDKGREDWFEQLLMAGITVGMSDNEIDALRFKHFPQKIAEEAEEKVLHKSPLISNNGLYY